METTPVAGERFGMDIAMVAIRHGILRITLLDWHLCVEVDDTAGGATTNLRRFGMQIRQWRASSTMRVR